MKLLVQMNRNFIHLCLFSLSLISSYVFSAPECDPEEPPIIKYSHNQIDDYLFTSVDVSPYNSAGEWIDYCFKNSFVVTNSSGKNKLLLWFQREALFEEHWMYTSALRGSFNGTDLSSKQHYSVFELGSGGSIGSKFNVFMTYPSFKLVYENYVLLKEIIKDGIIVIERNLDSDALKECWDDFSMATWPVNEVEYTFNNGDLNKKIIKEGKCND